MLWLIYFGILIFHLFAITSSETSWMMSSKPLLMPVLMAAIFFRTRFSSKLSKLLAAGVFFGWLGDIFLMFNGTGYFAAGLSAFLIGHIFYITLFSSEVSLSRHTHFVMEKPFLIVPFVAFWIYLITLFSGKTAPSPAFPIYLYGFVICLMSVFAFNRKYAVSLISWLAVITGSLLFIFSDLIIAYNKFIDIIPNDRLIVMSTYATAQFLIVWGSLKNQTI